MSLPVPKPIVGVRLASLAVHVDELLNGQGVLLADKAQRFDVDAIQALLGDADVRAYLEELRPLALLPAKRDVREEATDA